MIKRICPWSPPHSSQILKASTALLRFLKKEAEKSGSKGLLGDDVDPETISVNFVLHKLPKEVRHKPVRV